MSDTHAHGPDEYLMTIYLLAHPVGEYLPSRSGPVPTAAARIADQLQVSRASVGEMLKRLEADGLVTRGERKEAILTAKGLETAGRVVRRHRLIERLLTDVMGYSAPEAHEKADGLDEGFDDEMIERLYEKLGRPDRCPHGYPIDPADELAENPTLTDGDLLHHYYDAGLAPGTAITVAAANGDGGDVSVERDGGSVTLTHPQAQGVFVLPS